ncbi:hypothetical protein P5673_018164, partial [Acropora cervicornis]
TYAFCQIEMENARMEFSHALLRKDLWSLYLHVQSLFHRVELMIFFCSKPLNLPPEYRLLYEYVRSENDYPRYKLSDANESLLVEEKNFALMKSKYCSAVDHHMSSSRLDLQYEAYYNRIANKYFPIGYPTVLHCHWLQEQSDSPREDNDL